MSFNNPINVFARPGSPLKVYEEAIIKFEMRNIPGQWLDQEGWERHIFRPPFLWTGKANPELIDVNIGFF
jgi:hypothetical protein